MSTLTTQYEMKKKLTLEIIIRRMIILKKLRGGHPDFFHLWGKLRLYLYKTKEYQAWMFAVKAKSDFKCARDRCRKKPKECHHKVRVYEDPAKSLDISNGEFLCFFHHRKEHSSKKKINEVTEKAALQQ